MNDSPYLILSAPLMVQTEVKRSKFLAYIAPTAGVGEAKEFIAQIRKRHPDASHNCFAFVANRPENSIEIGFSDDGEPSGCAGRPMLNVLQGSGIGEITVVVSRYFGGTKLGTGGMARAYGAAVNAALAQAQTIEKSVTCVLNCRSGYQWTNLVELLINQFDAKLMSANYGEQIDYTIQIDVRRASEFSRTLLERSNGQLVIKNSENICF